MNPTDQVDFESLPFALNVNLTPSCNLKCSYCFAQGGNYGTITGPMDGSFGDEIVSIFKKYASKTKHIRLEYFGGEPLMNFSVMKEIYQKVDQFAKKFDKEVINRISTNFTYLSSEMEQFFVENEFIISISIDGVKEVQDRNRPYRNGEGSYDKILQNITRLKNSNGSSNRFVARITYHDLSHSLISHIEELLDTGLFFHVSIYPSISSWSDNDPSFREKILEQFKIVVDKYEYLLGKYKNFRGILEFDQIISQIVTGKKSINHCRAGTRYFTLSPDRKLVPCHRFAGDEKFNRDNALVDANWMINVSQIEKCRACDVSNICGGGCRHENYIVTGDLNTPSEHVCFYQKNLISYINKNIQSLKKTSSNKKTAELSDMFTYCGRQTV